MSGAIGEDSGPGAGTSPGRSGKSCGACPGDGGGFKSGSAGSGEGASGSGTGLSGCGLIDAMPPPHGRPRSRSARPLLLLGLMAGALARLRGMSGVGLVALTFLVLLRRPVLVAVVLGIHGGLPHGQRPENAGSHAVVPCPEAEPQRPLACSATAGPYKAPT